MAITPDPFAAQTLTQLIDDRESRQLPKMDKIRVGEVGIAAGVRVPLRYALVDHAQSLDFSALPDRFVLKPTCLWGSAGVMLLTRGANPGSYLDALRSRTLSADQIVAEHTALREKWYAVKRSREYRLLAEEWVQDEGGVVIPWDYKFYMFGTDVRFIVQADRNDRPPRFAFFLDEFRVPDRLDDYLTSDWVKIAPGSPRRPRCHRQLVDAARAIAAELRTPFISVDLYATPDGPVLGELTPTPGSPRTMFRFTPGFNAELGEAWRAAERALAGSAAAG